MLTITCSSCQKKLSVHEDLAGKKVKCPSCGQVTVVPMQPTVIGTEDMRTVPPAPANTHPGPELLQRFGGGVMSGPEADAIQDHVATCTVCSAWLSEQTQPPQPNQDLAIDPATEGTLAHAFAASPIARSEKLDADLPERVGRYRLEHEIARGGMGQVVRVTDEAFQRPLAMKIALGGATQMSQVAQERFVREARVTGQLQHPGIPPVQEMGQLDDGRPYFIMKLIQGSDLRDLLRHRSSVGGDLPRFVAIFGQICQTLGYAHSHGIIHRDLKPANIMVGAFGEVQVMDWGLAKLIKSDCGVRAGGETERRGLPSPFPLLPSRLPPFSVAYFPAPPLRKPRRAR